MEFSERGAERLRDLELRYFRVVWLGSERPELTRQLPEGARQDSVLVYLGTLDLVADAALMETI